MKKLTKQQAFDLIKDNTGLNEEDKTQLMRFFLPPVPKSTKDVMSWLGRIVDQKDVRVYLRYIYVSDGRACATNGHVLLWTKTDLADGFYCPKLHTQVEVEVGLRYPDIEPVISAQSKGKRRTLALADLAMKQVNSKLATLTGDQHIPNKPNKNGVCESYDKRYIDWATNGEDVALDIYDVAARGKCSHGEFIIMGLRS